MEGIDVGKLSGCIDQIPQSLEALEHLLDGIRAEQVVVDEIQLARVLARVALGPLLGVADRTHAPEVDSRDKEGGVVLLYEIRERQIACVGVGDVAAHYEGESPDSGRPEYI